MVYRSDDTFDPIKPFLFACQIIPQKDSMQNHSKLNLILFIVISIAVCKFIGLHNIFQSQVYVIDNTVIQLSVDVPLSKLTELFSHVYIGNQIIA